MSGKGTPLTLADNMNDTMNVWIGANAVVCAGVTVGDNAVIAAGAVVVRDVEKNMVVGGVPAKQIKRID